MDINPDALSNDAVLFRLLTTIVKVDARFKHTLCIESLSLSSDNV